jgi:cellulose biosynthesis protein BcsQ
MKPCILTIFNNKGGVGKTTLTFHMAHALGILQKKILLVDFDPQCNLTIVALPEKEIADIWIPEDAFIEDFEAATEAVGKPKMDRLLGTPRSIHFNLKPTEDGISEFEPLPPPVMLTDFVHLLPGRLTLHLYEAKVGERWSNIYQGDPLAIRTATRARELVYAYAERSGYDIVIFDTSPSLGALNRHILTLADAFIIPCAPDLFSLYGIKNIGSALRLWHKQFQTIFTLLSDAKRNQFPRNFVKFIGFTIYNAKKYGGNRNELDLANAHFDFARKIPETIRSVIDQEFALPFDSILTGSIGDNSVIHGHNTFTSLAQKYHKPMWEIPNLNLEAEDVSSVTGMKQKFFETKEKYKTFAEDVLKRVEKL